MRYVSDRVGVEHVALGSDFDGAITAPFDTTGLVEITDAMLEAGYSEQEIRMIMGENVVKFLAGESAGEVRVGGLRNSGDVLPVLAARPSCPRHGPFDFAQDRLARVPSADTEARVFMQPLAADPECAARAALGADGRGRPSPHVVSCRRSGDIGRGRGGRFPPFASPFPRLLAGFHRARDLWRDPIP